jgi:hypothetical protein
VGKSAKHVLVTRSDLVRQYLHGRLTVFFSWTGPPIKMLNPEKITHIENFKILVVSRHYYIDVVDGLMMFVQEFTLLKTTRHATRWDKQLDLSLLCRDSKNRNFSDMQQTKEL